MFNCSASVAPLPAKNDKGLEVTLQVPLSAPPVFLSYRLSSYPTAAVRPGAHKLTVRR